MAGATVKSSHADLKLLRKSNRSQDVFLFSGHPRIPSFFSRSPPASARLSAHRLSEEDRMALTKNDTKQQTGNPSPPRTLEEHLAWVAAASATGANLRPLAEGLLREKFALQAVLEQV